MQLWLTVSATDSGSSQMTNRTAQVQVFFGWSKTIWRIGLDELQAYTQTVERMFKRELADLERQYSEELEELRDKERLSRFDFYEDDFWRLGESFPTTLRESILVATCGFLEQQLDLLCERCRREYRLQLSVKEISGKGIRRACLYLKKVAGIEFPDDSENWKKILVYQGLRNAIVHNGGNLSNQQDSRQIREFIEQSSDKVIKLSKQKQSIQLGEDFLPGALSTIESFLTQLWELNRGR